MITYTQAITNYKTLTKNSQTANVTLGQSLIDEGIRKACSALPFDFLYDSDTDTTVASQQYYYFPWNYKKLKTVNITVGTQKYTPKEAPNRVFWDKLNQSGSTTSDTPEWYFIENNRIGFYPIPATADNTITFNFRKRTVLISAEDYTTGTITLTNGSATVTGSGTTFTSAMVGRWIKLDDYDEWYEISAFVSTTELTLRQAYQGITSAGASYTIGEVGPLPEDYQMIPIHYAVAVYWGNQGNNSNKYELHKSLFEEGMLELIKDYGSKSDNPVIEEEQISQLNPNLYVEK